jgi:hypothetical protein
MSINIDRKTAEEALEAHLMLREWIKAVPKEVVLPAMPGIDGDWLDEVEMNLCTALAQPEAEPIAAEQGTIIIEMDCGSIQSTISKGVTASCVIIDRAAEFADEDSIVQIDGERVSVHRYSVNGGEDDEVDRVLAQLGNDTAGQSSTP